MESSSFDFRFSQIEFVKALFKALGFEKSLTDKCIKQRRDRLRKITDSFKPYIWVDTEFKRQSQPIFALAFCEHMRYIEFPRTFFLNSIETQLRIAGERAALCYQETGGLLAIWGEIKRFRFYVAKNEAYILDTQGKVVGKYNGSVDNKATLEKDGASVAKIVDKKQTNSGEH